LSLPQPWLFAFGFPIFFVAVWLLAGSLVALMSGWRCLGDQYRCDAEFPVASRSMQSGTMRFNTRYGNVLRVGIDSCSLHLAVMPLFRVGHPHLCIPWSDIEIMPPRTVWFFFERQTLLLGPEKISLTLEKNLITFLRERQMMLPRGGVG
jgi:hypothetical protein